MNNHPSRPLPVLTDEQRALVEVALPYAYLTVKRKALPHHILPDERDIVAECYLMLCRAAADYDPSMGSWRTYAISRLIHVPQEYLRARDVLPRAQRELRTRVQRETDLLRYELQREPTQQELAARLGITPESLETNREYDSRAAAWMRARSLNHRLWESDEDVPTADDLQDLVPAEDRYGEREPVCNAVLRQEIVERVRDAIDSLPQQRMRHIARRFFLDEARQKEIALECGICDSNVCQIIARIKPLLRTSLADLMDGEGG